MRKEELASREPRPEKLQAVEEIASRLKESGGALLTDYRGLPVKTMNSLRDTLREKGAAYAVIKNSLLRFAVEKAGTEGLQDLLEGPTAVVFLPEEVAPPTKALVDFIKDHNNLPVIKGGFVEGKAFDAEAVKRLADLPSREVLLANLVLTLQAPLASLASTLQAKMIELAGTLQALADKKEQAAA